MKNKKIKSSKTIKKHSTQKKGKYKLRNWKEYNQALVDRYDFMLWIEKGIAEVWKEGNTIIINLGINAQTEHREAVELTDNSVDDGEMINPLLRQISKSIHTIVADGAYDKKKVYEALHDRNIENILIPPRKDAHIWIHGNNKGISHPRDENIRMIRNTGRKQWKQDIGYHQRSLAETGMYRLKTIFSDRLSGRDLEHQIIEVRLKCKILNKMTELGMPDSYKVDYRVT